MKFFILLIFLIHVSSVAFADCGKYAPCIEVSKQEFEKVSYTPLVIQQNLEVAAGGIVHELNQYIGIPYKWGGENTNGIDCSAFTMQAFREKGINLPRTSRQQFNSADLIEVSTDELRPWDLLFFKKSPWKAISHVAIYVGDGKMIHSSKNEGGVYVSEFNNSGIWKRLFFKAKRMQYEKNL